MWNLGGEKEIRVPVKERIQDIKVGYPRSLETNFTYTENALTVRFDGYAARVFELVMKEKI